MSAACGLITVLSTVPDVLAHAVIASQSWRHLDEVVVRHRASLTINQNNETERDYLESAIR
jgi:hypothetical protein